MATVRCYWWWEGYADARDEEDGRKPVEGSHEKYGRISFSEAIHAYERGHNAYTREAE